MGALSKNQLYQLYKTVGVYIYPTDFEEISCITAMELMACGTPMIASAHAALPETLHPEAGALIPYDEAKGARHDDYQEAFVDATMSLLKDNGNWRRASEAGKRAAKSLHWDGVADQWEKLAQDLLSKT